MRARLIEGGALVLIGAACLFFQARLPSRLPDEAEYREVQQVLEAEAQPGDALLLHPWWAERARLYAPDRVTVIGYQGSDSDSLELYPRVWVLSQPDLPRADQSDFMKTFSDRRTAIGAARDFGHLSLTLYQNGRARPLTFSSMAALASARVSIEQPDGSHIDCPWNGRTHRCPKGEVGVEWHEVHFQPRQCLRFFPPGGAAKLVAEFSSVPAADQLVLQAGFIWDRGFFKDEARFTPTNLAVEVNGQPSATMTLPAGLEGLQRATSSSAVPEGSSLKLEVAAQSADLREICVEVYGFGGAP